MPAQATSFSLCHLPLLGILVLRRAFRLSDRHRAALVLVLGSVALTQRATDT